MLCIACVVFVLSTKAQLIGDFVPAVQTTEANEFRLGVLVATTYEGDHAVIIHNYLIEEVTTTTLGLEKEKIHVNVFPNPVSDVLHIASEKLITSITVSDLTGRKLISETGISTKQSSINLKQLAESVVLLTLTFNNEKVKRIKISKVRP
ncbi:MAG: T9SS type A sorting domain-containing protein [Cytophagales bacterium]|nr:T9SS type A sorting domain-containing protein [Cytophagales bacterium]